MKKFVIQPGNEIRGFMIRLYPDKNTEDKLHVIEADARRAWNWLVQNVENTSKANESYAVRSGLVGPRPELPNYDGLSPEDAKKRKLDYIEAYKTWKRCVYEATHKLPECAIRKLPEWLSHFGCKQDYQLLSKVIGWAYENSTEARDIKPSAHTLQAIVRNYFQKSNPNNRRKKRRRNKDPMPLQVRSGVCFKLGNFGKRGKNEQFYNCQVTFNGLKIRGRLPGKQPGGRVLEGASITKKADGWWASIKVEVPIRILPPVIPNTVIGIDTGLDNIAALSEVIVVRNNTAKTISTMGSTMIHNHKQRIVNTRGKEYSERIAGRQLQNKPVGRLHLAAARHTKHQIYNDIIKPLADIETIKVEKLSSKIGQMGSNKTSAMRLAIHLLKERYGNRVREVEPAFTSQDCSQCGKRSKESWSYDHGRYGECPFCGYKEDRDVNAARNVAAKCPIPLQP